MNHTLAAAPHQTARSGMPAGPGKISRLCGWASLRSLMAAWSGRIRFRWELEQLAKESPHLIYDIGLTRRQAEAEIAKPFWQATDRPLARAALPRLHVRVREFASQDSSSA